MCSCALDRPERFRDHALRKNDCSEQGQSTVVPNIHVERALTVIKRDYANPSIGLAPIATRLGISAEHLSRLFRTHTGHTLTMHLRKQRVEKAGVLLATTQARICEVASAVGYKSTWSLHSDFKRAFCMSPREFRYCARDLSSTQS